jgi:CRISPR-associated protein Csd1
MILQRLAEHYDHLEQSGKVQLAKPGFSIQKISFCIVLEPDGKLNSFEDLRQQEGKTLQPRTMVVPGQGKPSGSGLNPCFLWDNAEYLLGWSADPDRLDRAARAFEAMLHQHTGLEALIDLPAYSAVCAFLRSWSREQAVEHAERLATVATHFGIFRLAGEQNFVHEVVRAPILERKSDVDTLTAMCLVSGITGESARLHEPKIKGVADAQTGGALLVSFNASAFTSHGKDQSFNAPVSTLAVFKYANALNHLLSQRNRRIALGDATVVFWADHATPLEDCLLDLFSGSALYDDVLPAEDKQRLDEARLLLTQLRDGTRNATILRDDEPTRFFILGLSPNASRLSVRLWVEADAPELERRLGQHLRDLELKGGRDERSPSVRLLANATGRYDPKGKAKFDTGGVSPQLSGELARSVLTGAAYPQSFLATMVRRIRSDAYIGFERVSAIKACLVRNSRLRGAPLEVPMELDTEKMDVAYRCGRLFALLEKAQTDSSDSEINSTIKDKYFSSASAMPSLVFPRLFRLNNHHLAKLETRGKIFYSRQMAAAMEAPFTFPSRLSLAEQGRFIVGYFQQRQDLYTKKEKAPEEKQ